LAATIHVNTSDPSINPGDGLCSLAEAIANANDNFPTFPDCASGSLGPDTLVLPMESTQVLSALLPVVTSEILIQGNGSTIDGDNTVDYVLRVTDPGHLILEATTITGAFGRGLQNDEVLEAVDCTITGNSGGGVLDRGSELNLTRCAITENGGSGEVGGGVAVGTIAPPAVVKITDCTILDNSVTGRGGGIFNNGAGPVTLTVVGTTIAGNQAAVGGGISSRVVGQNATSNVTVSNSTISGNTAAVGGGIYNWAADQADAAVLTVIHSTVTNNSASHADLGGGGIYNADSLFLERALVAGNLSTGGGPGREINNDAGAVAADDFNVFGFDGDDGLAGFAPGPTDVVPASGVLLSDIIDPLADNGGPTQTHALVSVSPALDIVATSCPPPATDQRGTVRPADGGTGDLFCDTGSFELEATASVGDVGSLDPSSALMVSPNPVFGISTRIYVPWREPSVLRVYDARGRLLGQKRLASQAGWVTAHLHEIALRHEFVSGIHFISLESRGTSLTTKLVLLR
jgi:hypothetical protein